MVPARDPCPRYVTYPTPRVQPCTQGPECTVIRGQGAPGESHCRSKKLAALVEQGDRFVGGPC